MLSAFHVSILHEKKKLPNDKNISIQTPSLSPLVLFSLNWPRPRGSCSNAEEAAAHALLPGIRRCLVGWGWIGKGRSGGT